MTQMTIEALTARQEITDVLHRYCRAMDRMDRELALSCWHEGATDDHAPNYVGSAVGFVDWVWTLHASLAWTRHETSNILIDLRGEEAAVESYCALTLRTRRDGEIFDVFSRGRYLDRFARIGGRWAIRHRQSLSEWHRVEKLDLTLAAFTDRPLLAAPAAAGGRGRRPARDRSDPSYDYLT